MLLAIFFTILWLNFHSKRRRTNKNQDWKMKQSKDFALLVMCITFGDGSGGHLYYAENLP